MYFNKNNLFLLFVVVFVNFGTKFGNRFKHNY